MNRRLLFLLTLLCCSIYGSRAATVSGTVTNAATSTPAASQMLYLVDSTSSAGMKYIDSTTTNSSGGYSFTVSSSITSGRFKIMSYSCNKQYNSPYNAYSGSNLSINLSVCVPITVTGTVSIGGVTAGSGQKVYLTDSGWATPVYRDSTVTNSSGQYTFTVPASVNSYFTYSVGCGTRWYSTLSNTFQGNLTLNLSVCPPVIVSGTVRFSSSVPATSWKVYLMDSSASLGVTYRDSTVTDTGGRYSFTVPSTTSTFRVYAFACGNKWSTAAYSTSGGSRTLNLTLSCGTAAIYDTVKTSSTGLPVWGQKVYLVVDSTATTYRLDSAISNKQGVVYFILNPMVPYGTKRIYTNACGVQSQNITYSGSTMFVSTPLYVCTANTFVTGTVTNVTTSAGARYQQLAFYDSSGSAQLHVDTVYTDATGAYSVILPLNLPASGTMIIATQACGFRHSNSGTYSGSSMTLNLSICATSTATISGTVTAQGTGAPISGRKVYFVDTNSLGGPVYRDSTTTNASGFYSMTIPPTSMSGSVWVSVPSCGGSLSRQNYWYMGSSITANFVVCSGTGVATFSGTIVDPKGTPISGANVSINSTVWTTTNSSGAYTLTIPSTYTYGTKLNWNAAYTCGSRNISHNYTGASFVRQDTIWNTGCFTIGGTITKQGGGAAASAKVYLIGEYQDSTVTPIGTILVALDSTITNSSGKYSFTRAGYYINPQRIKAALQTSDANYWNFLPTYHDSSLNWSGATTFRDTAWLTNANNLNVSLRSGTNPGGPGFIGGNVLVGANKSAAVGDPLAERILLLTTVNDVAVGYTYSDATGAFSFPNLPYGTYKLFGDAGGKTNPPLLITLSAGSATVNSVVFEENDKTFEGHVGNVGVRTQKSDDLRVYPNPAGAYIILNGLNKLAGTKTVTVKNVAGAVLFTQEVSSGDILNITTEKLPAGMYMLQVQSASGVRNIRFVKD